MEPTLHKVTVNGAELAYFEHGTGSGDTPTLLFLHATGFHARVWDHVIEGLGAVHAIALDQRGHGHSEKKSITHWQTMIDDAIAFVDALGLHDVVGVGHSMGGHALVGAAAASDAFARLVLLDPTISSPESYADGGPITPDGELHPAARRRARFASAEEMADRLRDKGAYGLWSPRVFMDYCRHGLLPTESGGFTLACPPEVEARVYMASRSNGAIHDSVRALDIPVFIMRAMAPPSAGSMGDFSFSPTWPGLAAAFPRGREQYYPDCTHFIPMQIPEEVVRVIRRELEDLASGESTVPRGGN